MMDIAEYATYDGLGLGRLVHSGEVSARELARTAASAVEALDPEINAVLEVFDDRIDDLDETGLGSGPFRGVPLFLKDLDSGEIGRRQEWGIPLFEGRRVDDEHLLTVNFKEAGFNIIGRSAVAPYGWSFDTTSALHGITRSPWHLARSPGGSSGGAAALVAAGIAPIAHGSDWGGSIRVPSAWSGLVGLKPTRGRVPLGGVNELAMHVAQEGVLTRTVRDTAAALDWMHRSRPGYSAIEIRPPHRPYLDEVGAAPGSLRIALSVGTWGRGTPPDPDVVGRVVEMARILEGLGHDIVEIADDDIADFEVFWEVSMLGRGGIGGLTLGLIAREMGAVADESTVGPVLSKSLAWSEQISAADLSALLGENQGICRRLARLFEHFDLLMVPSTAIRAPEAGGSLSALSAEDVEPWTERLFDAARYTPLGNETGIPGISLPAGLDADRVPVGAQLYAPWCDEWLLLRVAAQLESAKPEWFDRRPPIHAATAGADAGGIAEVNRDDKEEEQCSI